MNFFKYWYPLLLQYITNKLIRKNATLVIPNISYGLLRGNKANGIIICQNVVNVAPIDAQDIMSNVLIFIILRYITLSEIDRFISLVWGSMSIDYPFDSIIM